MADNHFVLDTNSIIFLTTKGNVIPSDLQNELDKAELFVSVISEIELFSKPSLLPEEEETLRSFFSERISIVNLTDSIKEKTITLRRTKKMKLPDCIIAATAIDLNAVLITNDSLLLSLSYPGYNVKPIK